MGQLGGGIVYYIDTFYDDAKVSTLRDISLRPYWASISYEGCFVIVSRKFLQKGRGIDVVIQETISTELLIDTKHVNGEYEDFYIEEYSNSVTKELGWLLRGESAEDGWPDIIVYVFWEGISIVAAYNLHFIPLRKWFDKYGSDCPSHVNRFTRNKTSGRLVPIEDLLSSRYKVRNKEGIMERRFIAEPIVDIQRFVEFGELAIF